jgi:hypothetical protein
MHNVGQFTTEQAIGKGGLLEGLIEARKRGWIKHIGCSGHFKPGLFVPVIDTGEIDLVMPAMNFVDCHTYNFEDRVLPAARNHNCAIVCMKVYGGVTGGWDGYKNRRPGRLAQDDQLRQDAVDYALTIPGVSSAWSASNAGGAPVDDPGPAAARWKANAAKPSRRGARRTMTGPNAGPVGRLVITSYGASSFIVQSI